MIVVFLRNLACYGKVYVAARQFILGIRICSKSYKQMDDRQENEVQASKELKTFQVLGAGCNFIIWAFKIQSAQFHSKPKAFLRSAWEG